MKQTTRRHFLQGAAGSTLALPLFESLLKASGDRRPDTRLAVYYVPMGVVRRGFFPGESETPIPGFTTDTTTTTTIAHEPGLRPLQVLTPTLQPLKPVIDKVTFITGLNRTYKQGSDVHAQCGSCFLSSATSESVDASIYPLDRTFDHMVADEVGGRLPFRTLELSCNNHLDNKESIYFDNISWYGTGHVAPSIRNPRKAYQRLFKMQQTAAYRDITDLVLRDAKSLVKKLGRSDRHKFNEYFDGIRSLELQMTKLEGMQDEFSKIHLDLPPEAMLPRGEYIRLMGDIMVTALQAGLTNVATLMIGPERWNTPYTFEGLFDKPVSHHLMSHNQKKFINELLQVDRFYMEQYVYIVQKMNSIREVDGSTLLDNTIFTYGSGLGDGATHQFKDLPIIVAGGGGGTLQQGKHLHCAADTPLSNLWLTQAQAMGLDLERFSDSSGIQSELLK